MSFNSFTIIINDSRPIYSDVIPMNQKMLQGTKCISCQHSIFFKRQHSICIHWSRRHWRSWAAPRTQGALAQLACGWVTTTVYGASQARVLKSKRVCRMQGHRVTKFWKRETKHSNVTTEEQFLLGSGQFCAWSKENIFESEWLHHPHLEIIFMCEWRHVLLL
jgi:hypothetical protein